MNTKLRGKLVSLNSTVRGGWLCGGGVDKWKYLTTEILIKLACCK